MYSTNETLLNEIKVNDLLTLTFLLAILDFVVPGCIHISQTYLVYEVILMVPAQFFQFLAELQSKAGRWNGDVRPDIRLSLCFNNLV